MLDSAHKLSLLVLLLAVVSCGDSTEVAPDRLVVLAPLELQVLLDPAMQRYASEFAPSSATAIYARSSQLVDRAGELRAAIMLSTHPSWTRVLADRLDVIEQRIVGRDRLVIAAAGTPDVLAAGGDALALLGRSALGTVALPDSESDSVGMYAREALLRYGIWSRVESNVTTTTDSVEAAANVISGSADVAILLGSGAAASGLLVLASFDPALHQAIRFEALLVNDRHPEAQRLWQFLTADPNGNTLARD